MLHELIVQKIGQCTIDILHYIHNSYRNVTISICILKAYHFLIELEHQAYWTFKKLNFDIQDTENKWLLKLIKMDEFRLYAYGNIKIYKNITKRFHDQHI